MKAGTPRRQRESLSAFEKRIKKELESEARRLERQAAGLRKSAAAFTTNGKAPR